MANRAYQLARQEIGTLEWEDGENPKIVQYFADVGHQWVKFDETPWCAAFVGSMLKRAGFPHTGKLTAKSYLTYGIPVKYSHAEEGDIVVFDRGYPGGWQGHVGFYVRPSAVGVVVLGGNQADAVKESVYPRTKLLAVRRIPEQADQSTIFDRILHTLKNIFGRFL